MRDPAIIVRGFDRPNIWLGAERYDDANAKDSALIERTIAADKPGIIYAAIGFPVEMFPVLFAIGRTPGWLAQWQEGLLDPEQKIARPRQVYIGPAERHLPVVREAVVSR